MHIALVNQWYPPETGGGGVATHNFHFANACVRLGHQVTVIASRLKAETPAQTQQNGVDVLRLLSPSLYRWRRLPMIGRQYRFMQAMLYSKRVCTALAALHREHSVDIVEFAEVNAEGYFWQQGIMGRKLVVRCHAPAWVLARYYTQSEAPYDATLLGWAEKQVIRRASHLTAPSKSMAQLVTEECKIPCTNMHVIPNALDTELLSPEPEGAPERPTTVLWVGRLERAKGADVLIAAIPRICEQVKDIRFIIVGGARPRPEGGTYDDFIRTQLAGQIAQGQVEVRGFMPNHDLPKVYREGDISVVPSLLPESFSFTVAEAMSCGLAVVASDIGGIPETLDEGRCGVLVKPGDAGALAEAVIGLANDRERRIMLGKAARERAVASFSADIVARRTLAVYEEALYE